MANFLCILMIVIPGTVRCLTFTTNGSTDGNTSFECNTNVSLVCQTQKRNDTIKDFLRLQLNDTGLVNCVTQCSVNTPVLGKYIVTHNFDAGTIRLDIPKITDADASNEFTCRESSSSLSIKPVIKVFPDKSSTKLIIRETNSTKVIDIKALTSCVLLQFNLTFVWNKTRYSNGTFLEPLSEEGFIITSTDAAEDSDCIPSDHCGGEARSSTLRFTEKTNGGADYYITCTILVNEPVSENKPRNYTVISERKFALKEEKVNDVNLDSTQCFSKTWCIVGVVIAILANILVVIMVIFKVRRIKSDEPTHFQAVSDAITESTVTLTWKPGNYRNYRQTFVVLYRLKDKNSMRWTDVCVQEEHKPTMHYKIDSLKKGKTYEFKIRAKNYMGVSKSSNIISVKTKGKAESPSELRDV